MKIKLAVLAFTFLCAVCDGQETRPEWDMDGDRSFCEEEEGEATEVQCHHHNRDIFFSPHFYDKGVEEKRMPAPDWPGHNDTFMDKMTR